MLASAAMNLGMASMTLQNKPPQTPPALPARPPIGQVVTPPTPSQSPVSKAAPILAPSFPQRSVPPPLPSLPPKGSLSSLESPIIDVDSKYISKFCLTLPFSRFYKEDIEIILNLNFLNSRCA